MRKLAMCIRGSQRKEYLVKKETLSREFSSFWKSVEKYNKVQWLPPTLRKQYKNVKGIIDNIMVSEYSEVEQSIFSM